MPRASTKRKTKPSSATPVISTELPAYLDIAPSTVVSPLAVSLKQTLPLGQLHWRDFERLCVRLIRREGNIVQCRLYGGEGQRQKGIDIFSRSDSGDIYVYQCKKVARFEASTLKNAVDLFSTDQWAINARRFVVCTSANGSKTAIADTLLDCADRLKTRNIAIALWDEEEMSQQLKNHPDLVHDFFGKHVLEAFLGRDAADSFPNRLTPEEVVRYRTHLSSFYASVFAEQDQPIPVPTKPGTASIPLLDRFVMPEILLERNPRVSNAGVEQNFDAIRADEDQRPTVDKNAPAQSRGNFALSVGRQPLGSWLQRSKHSLIVGGPGTGKSALLRCITLDLLSEQPRFSSLSVHWGGFLPVFVPFAFWTQEIITPGASSGLEECLQKWISSWGAAHCWPLVSKALKDERLLILLDGLDEWTSKEAADSALHMLQVFANTKQARIIASSRPEMSDSVRGADWQVGSLAPLNAEQQGHIIRFWFDHRYRMDSHGETNRVLTAEEARQFLRDLALSSDLDELARVPLLLLLLLYLRFRNAILPTGRFEAYEKVVDYLVENHLPHKRSSALVISAHDVVLRPREIRILFGFVAFSMQQKWHSGVIERDSLEVLMEQHISSTDGVGMHLSQVHTRQQVEMLVDRVILPSGLMVRQGAASVSFLHRTVQEYLAGFHLATLTPLEQHRFLEANWRARSWKEPILSLFSRLERSAEVGVLLSYLRSNADDTLDGMYARELAAELCFGASICPPELVREIAQQVFVAIEINEWSPHRIRLVRHALNGLRSLKTRDLVRAKLQQWTFRSTFGPWFDAFADWPSVPELYDSLFRGLHSEDLQTQKSAATILALRGCGDGTIRSQMIGVATSSLLPGRRAAALIGLSKGCPGDETLLGLIDRYRVDLSPVLRLAAVVAAVNCSVHRESDLGSLLQVNNERVQELPDYAWRGDTVDALVRGWPRHPKLKAACERSIKAPFRNSGELDRQIAEPVYLRAFPADPDVVAWAVTQLKDPRGTPFLSLRFDAFRYLAQNFKESVELSEALDEWAPKQQFSEPEIALSAAIGCTQVRKRKLIACLKLAHPFWAAESLLDNWGMQDDEVAEALSSMALGPAGPASAIGKFIPRILRDNVKALRRLLTLLDDDSCGWHHWVARGINSLKPTTDREQIAQRLLQARERTHPINRDSLDDAIITGFSDVLSVRLFAQESLRQRNPRFWAAAEAYGNDAEMRSLVLQLANPLPVFLRTELVDRLTSIPGDGFVREMLRNYDAEMNDEAKTLASIAYHRVIIGTDTSSDEEALERNIGCYGPDYEERRRAAFAGLVVLRRLNLMMREEKYGSSTRPLTISLEEMHRPNAPLLNLIGDEFEYIESTLGDTLKLRLAGHVSSSPNPYESIASVAYGRPALEQRIWTEITTDPAFAMKSQVLEFLSLHRAGTSYLRDLCVSVLFRGGEDFDAVSQLDVAVEVLADQFAFDDELMERILSAQQNNHLRQSQVLALCAGWPESDVVGELYNAVERGGIRASATPDAYYAIVFARCPTEALPSHTLKAIEHVAQRPMYTKRMVSALLRRLRRDVGARVSLGRLLADSSDVGVRNNILALLSSDGALTDEQLTAGVDDLHKEQQRVDGSRIAYDLMNEQYQSVVLGLMDRFGDRPLRTTSLAD